MKLSIWRQFNSNHSSDFTVVGEFESKEWAELIVEDLNQYLLDDYLWYEHHPTRLSSRDGYFNLQLNWSWGRHYLLRFLQVVDNYILVTNPDETQSVIPFYLKGYFEAMDGKVLSDEDAFIHRMDTVIKATAPNELALNQFLSSMEDTHWGYFIKEARLRIKSISQEGLQITLNTTDYINILPDVGKAYIALKSLMFHNIAVEFKGYENELSIGDIVIPLDNLPVKKPYWVVDDRHHISTIYARFADAQQAANDVRAILRSIADWSDAHPEESKYIWDAYWERLSPPEVELRDRYNITWDVSYVEWLHQSIRRYPVEEMVTVWDDFVILANLRDTFVGFQNFTGLLNMLDAEVILSSMYNHLVFDLRIEAKDAEQAKQIHEYLSLSESEDVIQPWLMFYGGTPVDAAWHQEAEQVLDYWQKMRQGLISLHIMKTEFRTMYLRMLEMLFTSHKIEWHDTTLSIHHVSFNKATTPQGITALFAWLESLGCSFEILPYVYVRR